MLPKGPFKCSIKQLPPVIHHYFPSPILPKTTPSLQLVYLSYPIYPNTKKSLQGSRKKIEKGWAHIMSTVYSKTSRSHLLILIRTPDAAFCLSFWSCSPLSWVMVLSSLHILVRHVLDDIHIYICVCVHSNHKLGAGFIREGSDNWRIFLPFCFKKILEAQLSLQCENKLCYDNMELRGL